MMSLDGFGCIKLIDLNCVGNENGTISCNMWYICIKFRKLAI